MVVRFESNYDPLYCSERDQWHCRRPIFLNHSDQQKHRIKGHDRGVDTNVHHRLRRCRPLLVRGVASYANLVKLIDWHQVHQRRRRRHIPHLGF